MSEQARAKKRFERENRKNKGENTARRIRERNAAARRRRDDMLADPVFALTAALMSRRNW